MANQKQKYNVYIYETVYDIEDDPNCFIHRRTLIGITYAVSEKQAVSQVRYRNGDKYSSYEDRYHELSYKAILADQDGDGDDII